MIDLGIYTKPPHEPPDYDELLKAIIVGGTGLVVAFSGILDDIKEWFVGLGANEGENQILIDGDIVEHFEDYAFTTVFEGNNRIFTVDGYSIRVLVQYQYSRYGQYNFAVSYEKPDGTFYTTETWSDVRNIRLVLGSRKDNTNNTYIFGEKSSSGITYVVTHPFTSPALIEDQPKESIDLNYYVTPTSSVITDIPPLYIPQPDISTLPNIVEQITPEGEKKYIYPGTMDYLLNDMKQNTTWEDLLDQAQNYQDGSFTPYTLTETQQGVEIDYGTNTETPYPGIVIEPIEDTSQFQGENIGLLKSIVNWLSNIKNEIVNIGDKIDNQVEEEIDEEEPKEIDFSPITSVSLTDKFPFSLPWDLKDSISLLASEGQAPVWEIPLVTETITIDMGEFEGIASIARVFNTLLFIISLIILTRRFI